jgi:hypothetical protein
MRPTLTARSSYSPVGWRAGNITGFFAARPLSQGILCLVIGGAVHRKFASIVAALL